MLMHHSLLGGFQLDINLIKTVSRDDDHASHPIEVISPPRGARRVDELTGGRSLVDAGSDIETDGACSIGRVDKDDITANASQFDTGTLVRVDRFFRINEFYLQQTGIDGLVVVVVETAASHDGQHAKYGI